MLSVFVKYLEVGAYLMRNLRTEFCVGAFQHTVVVFEETLDTPIALGGGGAKEADGRGSIHTLPIMVFIDS